MNVSRRQWLSGLLATGAASAAWTAVPGSARAICRLWQPVGAVEFEVSRDGERIGHHRVAFDRIGADYVVRTDIEIAVGLLGMDVFRFKHKAEEIWTDGWLNGLTSDTDDDGTIHSIRAERNPVGVFQLLADGRYHRTISGYLVPSSLWHRDTVRSRSLLDTIDGHVKLVRPLQLDEREVPYRGQVVMAKGYALRGQINRDLWYDDTCTLVRVAFDARDGSRIVLQSAA